MVNETENTITPGNEGITNNTTRSRQPNTNEKTIERVVHAANIHPESSHKTMDKKLEDCKKYFKFGYFLLPCIWLLIAVTLSQEYRKKDSRYTKRNEVKKYFHRSLIGCGAYAVIFFSWLSFYIYAYRSEQEWAYKIGGVYAII
uniref:Gamma-secretase subunit PEN-2 n=1 Tax=Parastrongyloides trichosuri TaxID=131310 RepID=A0A0N4ZQB2_PARTI